MLQARQLCPRIILSQSNQKLAVCQIRRTQFSHAQVTSALRPFFFKVHPDLFVQHPHIRSINEQSLKALNGYLSGLFEDGNYPTNSGTVPNPVQLKFYVRCGGRKTDANSHFGGNSAGQRKFKTVTVPIYERDPYSVVRRVLESASLSTEHLNQTYGSYPYQKVDTDEQLWLFLRRDRQKNFDMEWGTFEQRQTEAPVVKTLEEQLLELGKRARALRSKYEAVMRATQTQMKSLQLDTNLSSITFTADLEDKTMHTACLHALQRLVDSMGNGFAQRILKGKHIRFTTRNSAYVSCTGHIELGAGCVPEDWYTVLKNSEIRLNWLSNEASLYERAISRALGVKCVMPREQGESVHKYRVCVKRWNEILSPLIISVAAIPSQPVSIVLDTNSISSDYNADLDIGGNIVLTPPTNSRVDAFEVREKVQKMVLKAMACRKKQAVLQSELEAQIKTLTKSLKLESITFDAQLPAETVLFRLKRLHWRLTENCDKNSIENFEILEGCRLHLGRTFALSCLGRITVPCEQI